MEDRRMTVRVVSFVFFVLATIFVVLRFISRIGIVRRVALHDFCMLLAWCIDLGYIIAIGYATSSGLGLHAADVPPQNQPTLTRAEYAITVLYNPALMAIKTSILVFYLTLTREEKYFRRANYVTLFVVNAAGFALTMVNIFQCRPVTAVFLYPVPENAKCTDIVTLYLSSSPVNIITDLAIFFLPIPILTGIRLPPREKIILIITFSFGAFTAVVDVIRVAYLQNAATSRALAYQNSNGSNVSQLEHQDFSWYGAFTFMWSAIEINVGIMCACVPSLKPLVARVLPKLIKGTDDSTTATQPSKRTTPVTPSALSSDPQPTLATLPVGESSADGTAGRKGDPQSNSQNGSGSGSGSGSNNESATGANRNHQTRPENFVDLIDFLNAPENANPDVETSLATGTGSTRQNVTFFDFVNVKKPKSMVKMNNRESIPPVALTTILFFLWGFAYGLLDILNGQFQAIVKVNSWGSLGMHGAYYGGYLIGPLTVGRFVLTHWGFKATFITGLCIYACGTLIFWPSAVLTSFPAYTVCNFIVGFGLAVLETAANPFIAICGPLENSEVRLNFSQGVQAIGSVISPLLAKKVFFVHVQDAASLVDVQWTYLGIALFDVLLAVGFYYMPIPEASEEDLKELADQRHDTNSTRILGLRVVWVTFGLGVFSQWCYTGAQEALGEMFEPLVQALDPSSGLGSFNYLLIGRTLFAVGRFLAAFTQWFLKPRWILLFAYMSCIIFAVLCMYVRGTAGVVMGLMIYLFESGIFSIIFAISLRGLGPHTKSAASIMTAAISGGIMLPFPQQAAAYHRGEAFSFCVTAAAFGAGAIFPLYLNLVPAARKQVDPIPNEYLRHHHRRRHRQKENVVHREKSNPSLGGVLSRPRSVHEEPLGSMQLPSEVQAHDHAGTSDGTRSSEDVNNHDRHGSSRAEEQHEPPPLTGGIMHDLAPWPD